MAVITTMITVAAELSSSLGLFLPIASFLLVLIVLYAVLTKTEVLGKGKPMPLFVSLILATFFIMEASLVDFVKFNSAWVGVFAILIFFVMAILGFVPGDGALKILEKGNWFAWVVLGGLIALFIFSAAYAFNWVVDWSAVNSWVTTDWFGLVILLILAGIVSFVITRD